MKKLISVILCICFTLFSVIGYADSKVDNKLLEEKLLIVKSRVGSTDQYKAFEASERDYGNNSVYSFNWSDGPEGKSLSVNINSENIITHYYASYERLYKPSGKPDINKKTDSDVLKCAEDIFYSINPELKGKVKFSLPKYKNLYNSEYTVYIQRYENDYMVYGNSGNMVLSPDLNTLYSMNYYNSVNMVFENSQSIISYDDAKDNFAEKIGYKLIYTFDYDTKKMSLHYTPVHNINNCFINAINGELIDFEKLIEPGSEEAFSEDSLKSSASGGSNRAADKSEAEIREFELMGAFLSQNEIADMLYANECLKIDKNSKIENSHVSKDFYTQKYTRYIFFESDNEYVSVRCDANTGEILSFWRNFKNLNNKTDTNQKINKNTYAKEIATELADETIKKGKIFEETNNNAYDYFAYRVVNGIECDSEYIFASVDEISGKLINYSLCSSDYEFPAPDEAVTVDTAYDLLFENIKYEPVYVPCNTDEDKTTAYCVYRFNPDYIDINAIDGKLIYQFEDDEIEDYIDISGHYAEKSINLLKEFGIGFKGGKFEPDTNIKEGEFLELLAAAFGNNRTPIILKNGYSFENGYSFASRVGLENMSVDNSQNPLTREQACIMLIDAKGYGDVAKLEHIFTSPFKDVNNNIGYITILNAIGVINGDGSGNFKPDKVLTRAEAAVMLYNFLKNC